MQVEIKKEFMRKKNEIYYLDQFFTNQDQAIECIKKINLNEYDLFIEPSAGEGSFYYNLPNEKRIGVEIDEGLCRKHNEFVNSNYFEWELNNINEYKKILVIGNPPFGTQNKLSVNFFNYSANFCHTIAFLIPKIWNKKLFQNRLDRRFHLRESIDLPKNCFYGSKVTDVKCCFQIWDKKDYKREVQKKQIPTDWVFLKYKKENGNLIPPNDADFVVLAYGSKIGRISQDMHCWRPKSVHFIKSLIDKNVLMDRINNIDFSFFEDNSSRQSALSQTDLTEIYDLKWKSN